MTIAAASQAQDARLQQAVDKAQDRLDRALRAKADAEEAERRNDRAKQDAIGKEQHVDYRIRNVRDDIVRLENRLKTAQLKGDQVLAKFGPKMPELAKYLKGSPRARSVSHPSGRSARSSSSRIRSGREPWRRRLAGTSARTW